MKIDCQIHEENQCIFICVAQQCPSKSRFLCSECITEQNEQHSHSMVSLTSLNKMDQSAQFKLLSFADNKKTIIPNLKLHNVDEKVTKIQSFYDRIQNQVFDIIEAKKQNEISECQKTACSTFSLLKQSNVEELVSILNKTQTGINPADLDKKVNDFFVEYHKDGIQVEKFLNNCLLWEKKFSYVEEEKNFSEILFKLEQQFNRIAPLDKKPKSTLALEIANCIKNEEILLPPQIKFIQEKQVFSKVEGMQRHYIGIIDIPISRDLLKTSFKVKVHKAKWAAVGICDRDITINRDYHGEFKLLSEKNGMWVCSTNGSAFGSEFEDDYYRDSNIFYNKGDTLIVTPFDYKIEYYVESNPSRIYSQKFTYDEKKIYCPCFSFWSNDEDEIEFVK